MASDNQDFVMKNTIEIETDDIYQRISNECDIRKLLSLYNICSKGPITIITVYAKDVLETCFQIQLPADALDDYARIIIDGELNYSTLV